MSTHYKTVKTVNALTLKTVAALGFAAVVTSACSTSGKGARMQGENPTDKVVTNQAGNQTSDQKNDQKNNQAPAATPVPPKMSDQRVDQLTHQVQPQVNRDALNAPAFAATLNEQVKVNGSPVVELRHTPANLGQAEAGPQFTRVAILPGRGMNIFELQAQLPGKGLVNVIDSPPVAEMAKTFAASNDPYGNLSFSHGGAILVPYANRLRGKYDAKHHLVTTTVDGHHLHLPANWKGKNPGAEPHAMHGLILNSKVHIDAMKQDESGASVEGTLDAKDFGVKWPSQTELKFVVTLRADTMNLKVTAKNIGHHETPIGIGWHPYFAFPSGDRKQVRLRIPASQRALVDNYDNVFPTGHFESVENTPFDYKSGDGRALGGQFLDDCFFDLDRSKNQFPQAEIIDPAAGYGLRVRALSPEIKAFQVFAPVDKAFAAIEPQFNLGDPYGKEWQKKVDTGMVHLKPGESVSYEVQLQLFRPTDRPTK